MTRKIVSTVLIVSLMAMASSGILMLVHKGFAFQLKMHPVHNTFGIIMVVASVLHVVLNFKAVRSYFRVRPVVIIFILLSVFMAVSYVAGLNRNIDSSIAGKLDAVMRESGKFRGR